MAESRLHQLSSGQSVWIDSLSRDLADGRARAVMREDAVVGVTSNPTIFQKALAGGTCYDEQMREVLERRARPEGDVQPARRRDIGDACDLLRPVWDEGGGKDGYVSMEVDPTLADELEATIAEARGSTSDRPAEPLRQDPGHRARAGAIEE